MQNLCSARVLRARAWGISVLEFVVRGWNLDIGFWCILFLIIFVVVPQQQVEITESNMQSTKLSWENNEKLRRFRKNVGVFSDFLPRFVAKVLCFLGNLRSVFFYHQIESKLHSSPYFLSSFVQKVGEYLRIAWSSRQKWVYLRRSCGQLRFPTFNPPNDRTSWRLCC